MTKTIDLDDPIIARGLSNNSIVISKEELNTANILLKLSYDTDEVTDTSNTSDNNDTSDTNETSDRSETPPKKHRTRCGPKSWKDKQIIYSLTDSDEENYLTDEELELYNKPTLVRQINESRWLEKLNVLKQCGRDKIKDIFVDIHYNWKKSTNLLDMDLNNAIVYVILSLYNNDKIRYAKVTANLTKEIAEKKYNNEWKFDVTDFVLRNKESWLRVDYVKDQD